jgi:hypothetical protein
VAFEENGEKKKPAEKYFFGRLVVQAYYSPKITWA